MHPNGSVWNGQDPEYGIIEGKDGLFMASGNLKALYEHLKDMYEPKKESKSGPIKPMTKEEINIEDNKQIVNTLEELPPTRIY